MDRPLDDRIADRQYRGRGPPPRRPRSTAYPRDGVRKPARDDRTNLDNDWVHDRYDDEPSPKRSANVRSRPRRDDHSEERKSPEQESGPLPAKLRIDNLHYDLTEDDIYDLFTRIAPIKDAKLTYDRAGRSEGVAFVTYDRVADARQAIRDFDGANAKGQPIRITLLPLPPRATKRDNPFDRVQNPRSLFDRIEAPSSRGRRRSASPMNDIDQDDYTRDTSRRETRREPRGEPRTEPRGIPRGDRRSNVARPPPDNIDRYVPGQNGRSSSHRDGRRPGERRDRKPEEKTKGAPRPKKTQEELDAEMEDYWNSNQGGQGTESNATKPENANVAVGIDDIDMIE